jgi:hypothetical protein
MNGEKTATIRAVRVNANEISARLQPNWPLSGFKNTPNEKMTSEPKLTVIPSTEVITITHPRAT